MTAAKRLAGGTAVDTALKIFDAGKGRWSKTAVIATSYTYHDALSASPFAYAQAAPVFLANASTKTLDANVLDALKSGSFERVIIAGGPAAISESLDGQLADLGIKVERKWGATAYETSSALAKWCTTQGMSMENVGVATGEDYYDALTGAALCGLNNSALVLVSDDNRSALKDCLLPSKADIKEAYVFGGPAAVSEATYDLVVDALR